MTCSFKIFIVFSCKINYMKVARVTSFVDLGVEVGSKRLSLSVL